MAASSLMLSSKITTLSKRWDSVILAGFSGGASGCVGFVLPPDQEDPNTSSSSALHPCEADHIVLVAGADAAKGSTVIDTVRW